MIAKLSSSAATYFADKSIYKRDDIDIYKYGFELLISTILNIVGIIIISVCFNLFFEGTLFLISVILLRVTAGGYHANSHWACFLANNMTYLAFALLLKYVLFDYLIYYSIISVLVSTAVIWFLSPVEAKNKPLSKNKKIKVRKISLIISLINIILVLFFSLIIKQSHNYIAYYISGMLAVSLSLIAAKIFY
ncbi:MAG: accessory gene regulator B family protein [Lachnospiraceae bacterium]|nr:accessory gene regulator B family protein [Lachnospiraceae bacterium]